MPSLQVKKSRGTPRSLEQRRASFGCVTVNAIAASARGGFDPVVGAAARIISEFHSTSDYLAGALKFGEEELEWGHSDASRFYRFAVLLELGVEAGYVNLSDWREIDSFARALDRFIGGDALSANVPGAPLLSLKERIQRPEQAVSTLSRDAYFAFDSYLQLTRLTMIDGGFQDFVRETARQSSFNADLAFLISPRFFAEAMSTGKVGGMAFPQVGGGLAAIRYLRWYSDVLQRVSEHEVLRDNLIRYTRWGHERRAICDRLDRWLVRLEEWEEGSEHPRLTQAGLLPSDDDLIRLGIRRSGFDRWASFEALALPDQLIAEGRWPAARNQQRVLVEHLRRQVDTANELEWQRAGDELVRACARLAELGDVDAAASSLAPYVDVVATNFGVAHATTQLAYSILLTARTGSAPTVRGSTLTGKARAEQEGEDVPRPPAVTRKLRDE